MTSNFSLNIEQADKQFLHELVHAVIAGALGNAHTTPLALKDVSLPKPPSSEIFQQAFGAFVTLKKQNRLRGCIGWLATTEPLHTTVAKMAYAAAFNDSRFHPLQAKEIAELTVEISVLGPIVKCLDPDMVVVGKHGLIMRRGQQQGLLLPQVPVEQGWDKKTFLEQTCVKAGLPKEYWQDGSAEIFYFEAVVF